MGIKNGPVTLENNLALSYKAAHELTVQSRNSALRNLENSKVCLYQNLYTYIYSNYIHNNTELETTQMSHKGERVNKSWYRHRNRIPFPNKKELT